MEKKLFSMVIAMVVCASILIAGCGSEGGSTATPSSNAVPDVSEEEQQMTILTTATHAGVDTSGGKNWDADLEADGVIIYPGLKDATDETVKFEGVNLTVDINIWTTKLDDNFDEVKDRLVYSGSSSIDSWKDGNFMYDGGIRISFDDIKAIESDSDYGALYITIHTPDGKAFEAKDSLGIRIKPGET